MFEILFMQDFKIENLCCGALSSYAPRVFFSCYFFRLGFKNVEDVFQHARLTYEADGS